MFCELRLPDQKLCFCAKISEVRTCGLSVSYKIKDEFKNHKRICSDKVLNVHRKSEPRPNYSPFYKILGEFWRTTRNTINTQHRTASMHYAVILARKLLRPVGPGTRISPYRILAIFCGIAGRKSPVQIS